MVIRSFHDSIFAHYFDMRRISTSGMVVSELDALTFVRFVFFFPGLLFISN